ncbi:unnamed protein product, partial [Amoebophrya sp. A25]
GFCRLSFLELCVLVNVWQVWRAIQAGLVEAIALSVMPLALTLGQIFYVASVKKKSAHEMKETAMLNPSEIR